MLANGCEVKEPRVLEDLTGAGFILSLIGQSSVI